MRYLFPVCFLLSLCGLAFASAGAPTGSRPVDHAIHARDGDPCADAPPGARSMDDRRGLGSAESSQYTSTSVSRDGPVYDSSSICDTPRESAPARVAAERQRFVIQWRTAVRVARSDAGAIDRPWRAS